MEKETVVGKNIFVDFEIIEKSETNALKSEFETIISYKNNIIVWSKKKLRVYMKAYCKTLRVDMSDENIIRNKVKKLRKQKISYKDIADKLDIPVEHVGYHLRISNDKIWSLDDWIKEYRCKDSFIYQMVDFVIDPDEKFVEKFRKRGIDGNVIKYIG